MIVNLFEGDQRCVRLLDALEDTVKEKAIGMPMPSILGVIDLLKDLIKKMDCHE